MLVCLLYGEHVRFDVNASSVRGQANADSPTVQNIAVIPSQVSKERLSKTLDCTIHYYLITFTDYRNGFRIFFFTKFVALYTIH